MVSVKRSVSDISLGKNLSMSSPDLLTAGIREKSLPNGSNGRMPSSEQITQIVLTWAPTVYTNGLKLILEQSYEKNKKNKRKSFLKSMR